MKTRPLYLAAGIPAGILLFLLLTLAFTPNDAIKGVLVRAADGAGYTLSFTGFAKALPVGIKASSVELSSPQGSLLALREVRVRLELLPLLGGKLRLAYRGKIGTGGSLEGDATLGKAPGWSLDAHGIRLEDIPFFSTVAGAKVKGELRVTGSIATKKNVPEGDLQLAVKGAELAGVKMGAMPLPDASYRQIRGALHVEKGRAQLKSFTLDGEGIYVRLKGETMLATPLGASALNLTMEMMPQPAFLDKQKFVFLLLTKYQTSPGAFSIPIHGTLAHPAI
ncbi:MAG TPA: type II secretion system protein GspN [Geomonas sp.]|nr:type II secretion system protein GspN [Geomonas sp.]